MYLNNTEEDIQCIGAYIINMTNDASTLTNVCFELKAIPSNSTETVLLTKLRFPKMELKASGDTADGRGWHIRQSLMLQSKKFVGKETIFCLPSLLSCCKGNKKRSRAALATQLSVG